MKTLLVVGALLLLHCVYSTIEFHRFSKELVHPLPLPKDVRLTQIIVQLILAAVLALWASAPEKRSLMKIRADEFYRDTAYDEGQMNTSFRNYYASRASLISKRSLLKVKAPN
jgi:hypothetical protein